MSENTPADSHLSFSQRNGFEEIPPQLKVGELSVELKRLIDYSLDSEIGRESRNNYAGVFFRQTWEKVTRDIWVRFLKQPIESYNDDVSKWKATLRRVVFKAQFAKVFDLVEFLVKHPQCSDTLKSDLKQAFVDARAAYRVMDDGQICAIGNDQQAEAFLNAIDAADENQATGAKQHLINAGVALRIGDWSGSVRESIHAVESASVILAPNEGTLGAALRTIEKNGNIHGALKNAFSQLYGYTSDEEGVRHALVFNEKSTVDEVDALFMLGACASFVSYLLARAPVQNPQ